MKASASTRRWIAKLLILSAAAIVGVLTIGYFVCFRAFFIPSASMENTLFPGDRVMVDRIGPLLGAPPYRGELVAYHFPPDPTEVYLHRIVGIPGDRLKIVNKQLYRNGVELSEPYARHSSTYLVEYRDNFPDTPNMPLRPQAMDMLDNHVVNGELVVPDGHYFVLGDNRDDAADSRYFGFIQRSDVVGRPIMIYASKDPKRAWHSLH